jgi:hypothetical protein
MLLIRQELEAAVGRCNCRIGEELVSVLAIGDYAPATHAVHWTFRDAIVVLPPTSSSTGHPRLALHSSASTSASEESEACRKLIPASWPQEVVPTTWSSYPVPLPDDEAPVKCSLWGFGGSSLPSTFVYFLYVPSTSTGLQFRQPRLLYPASGGDEPARYRSSNIRCHPDMAYPRGPGDMNTGQVW